MKSYLIVALGTIALILAAANLVAAQERTFTGVLTDEQLNCNQNPMKIPPQEKGVPAWGKEECVLYWAHSANPKEKIVLYDPDKKMTYFVDNEDAVLPYVGDTQKVTVTGTYDEATKTIHVTRVQSK